MEVRLQQPDGAAASRKRQRSASDSPTDSDSSPAKRYPGNDERGAAERAADSDCESDTSEVLSVGHEPPPALTELEESTRGGSRSPSPAGSAGLSQPASSPSASSVRSPASSSFAASSPGPEPRYLAQPGLLDYPRLPAGHGLGHEIVYPSVERLSSHRAPIRLSFSPPSAMTVPGLQVATPILHPSACREPPTLGLGHPLQHALAGHLQPLQQMAAATTVHQHRLSVNRILQRDEPSSPRDEQAHQAQQAQQLLLNGSSRSSNGHPGDGHGNNASSNNNNSQHQASLKFSIDNILKADFGRRITDPISLKKSRPKKLAASRPIDLSKDFLESSSEGSERGSESSTRNVSPSLPASSPAPNPATPASGGAEPSKMMQWPAWVYCTRYSDRPSSGRSPRTRRPKRTTERPLATVPEEKRPRTAFSPEQLARLKHEFGENKYLNEQRRQSLSKELGLNEAQIKIWFQNKRAKIKKASGQRNPLALQLMAQGLYNHSTVPLSKEEMEQAAELQAK